MSWMDALDVGIEHLVFVRRRQRKRREGRWDWWDDEWRVKRALTEGIRYSDDELLEMMRGSSIPDLSYNEFMRMARLAA